MKKICFLLQLALLSMFTACSSDTDEILDSSRVEYEDLTVGVSMPGNNDTRVAFDGSITNLSWEDGDKLQVISRYTDMSKYPVVDNMDMIQIGTDKNTATFSKKVTKGDKYEFAYLGGNPYGVGVHYDGSVLDCDYDTQTQNGFNDYNHIKDHIFMKSEPLTSQEIKNGVKLNHKTSVFRINIKDIPKLISSSTDFEVSLHLNYVESSPNSSIIAKLSLSNATLSTTDPNYLYVAFESGKKLEYNKDIAIIFKSGVNTCVATGKCTKSEGVLYAPGKIYTLTVSENSQGGMHWVKKQDKPVGGSILDVVFDSNEKLADWTIEGGSEKDYSIVTDPVSSESYLSFNPEFSGTYYFVSPQIVMTGEIVGNYPKSNNKVTVKFTVDNQQGIDNIIGLRYRIVGTQKWEKITSFKASKSGTEISIPGKVNGKTIQLGFYYNKQKNVNWHIYSINVRGL